MKSYSKIVFAIFLIVLILTNTSYSQTIGKIFSKTEADSLFGAVLNYKTMPADELRLILTKTNNYAMFKILNGSIAILGDGRKVLYPASLSVTKEEVFRCFSVSIVNELLNKGGNPSIFVEERSEVLTITCGAFTLDFSVGCPPVCPGD